MNFVEILLIGIGLSMDAAAVSISNSMVFKNTGRIKTAAMPIFFGLFQGLMPVLGFFAGSAAAEFITKYAGIITLLILGLIGLNMIKEGLKNQGNDNNINTEACLTYKLLFVQAIATSIDAFAVGISFCALKQPIFKASPIIALTTFIFSILAIMFGKKIGHLLENKAQIFGGATLLLIGIKAII